mgnify:CR=1 FL=1
MPETIDITPNTAVLGMLGKVEMQSWQCICEIIDNSIDAYDDSPLKSAISGDSRAKVKITLPSTSRNNITKDDLLVIEDNAKGMTHAELSKSIQAGYSSRTNVAKKGKLGLFGMGFNVATARLGSLVVVKTTTKDSDEFLETTIDLMKIKETNSFQTPLNRIPKKPDEKNKHGTTVTISGLNIERIKPLYSKSKIKKKIGRVYSQVMVEKGIEIYFSDGPCTAFMHCRWDDVRTGNSAKHGTVNAVIKIDHVIDEKNYCSVCNNWLADNEIECSSCQSKGDISKIERRIKGWVGVQRFFSEDFGIDLIRNGRVIEQFNKDFFDWIPPDEGETELEYPIDGNALWGRLIGELDISFVALSDYRKESFDKTTRDWKDVLNHVRGDGPFRPKIASDKGFSTNDSPLGKLFGAFRTTKASPANLVPRRPGGTGTMSLISGEEINDLKSRFFNGESGYVDDQKWWELVNANTLSPTVEPSPFDEPKEPIDPIKPQPDINPKPEIPKEKCEELSGIYAVDDLKGIDVKVTAEKVLDGTEISDFTVQAKGNELFFTYWPGSLLFTETLLTPADFLINELAFQLHTVSLNEVSKIPITRIELTLRKHYFPDLYPTKDRVSGLVNILQEDMREHLRSKAGDYEVRTPLFANSDLENIKARFQKNEHKSDHQIEDLINKGDFINYASFNTVKVIICDKPHLIFDGKFFEKVIHEADRYNPETVRLSDALESYLNDVDWFIENEGAPAGPFWPSRVKRLIGSLEIIARLRV